MKSVGEEVFSSGSINLLCKLPCTVSTASAVLGRSNTTAKKGENN